MNCLYDHFEEILIPEIELRSGVAGLGWRIENEYRGKDLVVVGLLTGCIPFMGDLIQHIGLPLEMDFMKLSAYGDRTSTDGRVEVRKDIDVAVAGRDVLIVDEVLDTGVSMAKAVALVQARNPASIRTCVLIEKKIPRNIDLCPDYVGFQLGPDWIAGYGLDYKGRYRNCPFIGKLKPERMT